MASAAMGMSRDFLGAMNGADGGGDVADDASAGTGSPEGDSAGTSVFVASAGGTTTGISTGDGGAGYWRGTRGAGSLLRGLESSMSGSME